VVATGALDLVALDLVTATTLAVVAGLPAQVPAPLLTALVPVVRVASPTSLVRQLPMLAVAAAAATRTARLPALQAVLAEVAQEELTPMELLAPTA